MKKITLITLATIALFLITENGIAQNLLMGVNGSGAPGVGGNIFTMTNSGTNYINRSNFVIDNPGFNGSRNKPCLATDGKLYITPNASGYYGGGVIAQYNPTTDTYTPFYHFNPTPDGYGCNGGVIQATNGKLYGMASGGGANNCGTIFSYDLSTSTFTKLYDFTTLTGSNPNGRLFQVGNGILYGMTYMGGLNSVGVLFQFDISTGTYTKLFDFDTTNGGYPTGSLMEITGSKLVGLTSSGGINSGGIIFEWNYSVGTFTKKYDFTTAVGTGPGGSFTQAPNGKLYAVTQSSGAGLPFPGGTIIEYTESINTVVKKIDFSYNGPGFGSTCDLELAANGKFYGLGGGGTTQDGVIFQYAYTTNTLTILYNMTPSNGAGSGGSLTQFTNGKLYGISNSGGNSPDGYNDGDLYEFDYSTSIFVQKKILNYSLNGNRPNGAVLLASDGMYYGTTQNGGIYGWGTLYKYDINTNTTTKLHDFDKTNGARPAGSLIQATDGKLYGVTSEGGANNFGVIFDYNISNNTFTNRLDCYFVQYVGTGLMQASNGKLYGVGSGGGGGLGVIFSFDPISSTFNYQDFTAMSSLNQGSGAAGTPVEGANGYLYGMTYSGGLANYGTVYEYHPANNSMTKKFDLLNLSLHSGSGALVIGPTGNFFGMTGQDGANNRGTIFEYNYLSNNITVRYNPTVADGYITSSALFLASDGNFYGYAGAGTNSSGTVFQWNPTTYAYSTIYNFNLPTTGGGPTGSLIEVSCGSLAQPGSIFGSASVCEGSTNTYNVSFVANATSYSWTLPGGWTGTTTSNSITTMAGAAGGNISVTANNACNSSTAQSLPVTVHPLPTVTYSQNPTLACINNSAAVLAGVSPIGGTFSGTYVSANTFNATSAGLGTFPVTYTYTDANSCVNTASSNITVDACTGVNQLTTNSEQLIISPNPTMGELRITFFDKLRMTELGIKEVMVYNVLGECVYQSTLEINQTTIDLSKQSNGIYFIKISNENNSTVKKIIKQ